MSDSEDERVSRSYQQHNSNPNFFESELPEITDHEESSPDQYESKQLPAQPVEIDRRGELQQADETNLLDRTMPEFHMVEPSDKVFQSLQQQQDFLLMSVKEEPQEVAKPPPNVQEHPEQCPNDGSFTYESFKNDLVVNPGD